MSKNMTLTILLTNIFIAFLGIGLVIPVLPTIMNELHLSGAMVGNLVAAFAIVQLIVSPIAGRWVDQFGRKRMIVIGLIIFSFSELLFGLGMTVNVLFISRMLGGVSAAFIMPAVTAFIADITTVETRSKSMGYMSAAISTGFIVGPGVGGFLAEIGTRLPFFAAATVAMISAIASLLLLQEPKRQKAAMVQEKHNGLKRTFNPLYVYAFAIIFISSFGLAAFDSLFSLFVDRKFGFTPKDIAIIITGGAIVGAISQVILFDGLTRFLGEIKLIRYCFIVSGILVFVTTQVNTYAGILIATIFVFVGFDLMRPAFTGYLSKVAGNEQGFVSGMNSMFTSVGNVFGPMVGGFLFDIHFDYPFYFAAIAMVIGIVITLFWKKPQASELPPTV
ncbi:MAG TPA: MFS transporter [Pseudogracilibacillus sp.]|nr:MFS transporter [Pseudogracilibacillus sp.]